jgi:hypothetical protein
MLTATGFLWHFGLSRDTWSDLTFIIGTFVTLEWFCSYVILFLCRLGEEPTELF